MLVNYYRGCEEDEYAALDATESCLKLRSGAEGSPKMASELPGEQVKPIGQLARHAAGFNGCDTTSVVRAGMPPVIGAWCRHFILW